MAIIKPYNYLNKDGLPWKFGEKESDFGLVAGYRTDGDERFIEVTIKDISKLNATDEYLLSEKVSLPKGSVVTRVAVGPYSTIFASSGSGTVSIGTVDKDFASNNDIDSLLAVASVAEMNGGGLGNSGAAKASPGDGAEVMVAPSTKIRFLTLSVDTAVFQTGAGSVRIYWAVPKGNSTDTLVYTKP